MSRPSRHQSLMSVAQIIAERSTCQRLNVGAVVARDGRIMTTGYNGPPSGMPHCDHPPENDYGVPHTKPCTVAVHAETNAIAFAARYGMATEHAELYVTHSPCGTCAKLIVNAGIVRVAYGVEFRDLTGLDLLESAGIETFYVPQ